MVAKVCNTLSAVGWHLYISPPNTTVYVQAMDRNEINKRFKKEVEENSLNGWERKWNLEPKKAVPAPQRFQVAE